MFSKNKIIILLASLLVGLLFSLIVFITINDYGVTWDEPIYFSRGEAYISWILKPRFTNIDGFWSARDTDIHPPFRKIITGLTHELFFKRLHLMNVLAAYRSSTLFFVFPLIFLIMFYMSYHYGLLIGLAIASSFYLIPQVYFLSNLVTLDYAIGALWFWAVIVFTKIKLNRYWILLSGIILGLSMSTKLHGYFLIIPLILSIFIYENRNKTGNTFIKFIEVLGIAVSVNFIIWPWLWIKPTNIISYLSMQFGHHAAPVWYFGKLYGDIPAPWHYPFIATFISLPSLLIILYLLGSLLILHKGSKNEKYLLFNSIYPLLIFILPFSPKHDGVRLLIPSYPFVAIIAGIGVFKITKLINSKIIRKIFVIIWLFLIIYFGYKSVIKIHPFESSYYNEFVGGIDGATKLGFESEYWGNSFIAVLPWMNYHKSDPMCVFPVTSPFYYYLAMGQLEPGVTFLSGMDKCKYLIVLMRQGYIISDSNINKIVVNNKPIYSVKLSNTPLVSVFKLR
jgi:4-amino-4-deoxy-L-arabinose transferase-like glycosyltransferase